MKIKRKIIKKTILIPFIIYWIFLNSLSAVAASFGGGGGGELGKLSPTNVMNQIMKDLGVNKGEVRNSVQTFNVSRKKKTPPTVSIVFNPANPVPGEKVTATALPIFFMNDPKDLYFTWYLKNKECTRGDSSRLSADAKKRCDLNDSSKIDIEDYKIKAARIRVNNGYDESVANYDSADRRRKGLTSDKDNDAYAAVNGGNDQKGKTAHCYYHDTGTGEEYELKGCEGDGGHLFPRSYSIESNTDQINKDRRTAVCDARCCCGDNLKMGMNLFDSRVTCPSKGGEINCGGNPLSHEKFWHTNPDDPDTAGVGTVDEATIIGLGATSFTWTYAQGDELGVAVEGVSVDPTQYNDSSYKIMWAFSQNRCNLGNIQNDDNASSSDSGNLCGDLGEGSTDMNCTDPNRYTDKTVQDLNECLYDNFVTPSGDTGINGKLDVTLTNDPANPINDANGKAGDEVSFMANVMNVTDPTYLNFDWKVYLSDAINSEDWGTPLLKAKLPDSTQTSGLGINTFKFNMNFPEDTLDNNKYLKVKVTVTNTQSEKSASRGNSDVIIPILSSSEKINVYPAKTELIDGKVKLSFDATEKCLGKDNLPTTICNVLKDEIIGVKIENMDDMTDFSWKLDGKLIGSFSSSAEETLSSIFFPVLKDPSTQFTVSLDALNKKNGERVSLERVFRVVEPEIKIISADENIARGKKLGDFVDLDGNYWPDYSQTEFEAAIGDRPIKLTTSSDAKNIPGFSSDWYVDNTLVTNGNYPLDNEGILTLSPKEINQFYDVAIAASYVPDLNVKKALNEYWGIGYNEFYEKQFGATIRIKMVDNMTDAAQIDSLRPTPKRILAAAASGLPSYLAFLLRITLSIALILFILSLVFSLAPKLNENED